MSECLLRLPAPGSALETNATQTYLRQAGGRHGARAVAEELLEVGHVEAVGAGRVVAEGEVHREGDVVLQVLAHPGAVRDHLHPCRQRPRLGTSTSSPPPSLRSFPRAG